MDDDLCIKLNELPKEKRSFFLNRLYEILNDRVYSFMYGIKGEDYNTLPKEKIEILEKRLYEEMFLSKS